MIPQAFITEWRKEAPWPSDAQVEQDLVISRALIEIFSDAVLKENLGFRGGTAIHKLYLSPAVRYSEDIDLIQINSSWFSGKTELSTFTLEEMLGSKMRALYQRKQGRDLFDLWHAVTNNKPVTDQVIDCFYRFMEASEVNVSRIEYEENLTLKMRDRGFNVDIRTLLRPDFQYDPHTAFAVVMESLISKRD